MWPPNVRLEVYIADASGSAKRPYAGGATLVEPSPILRLIFRFETLRNGLVRRVPSLMAFLILTSLVGPAEAGRGSLASQDPAEIARLGLRVFTDRDGLPQNAITAIDFDRDGRLWIGTKDGAAYYDGRSWTAVKLPTANRANWVISMLAASDGSLWFGVNRGGVMRLKDGVWSAFDAASGLPGDSVHALAEGHSPRGDRVVWAGTLKGVAWLDGDRWRVPEGAPELSVRCLLEVVSERGIPALWVGTHESGLARFEGGEWTTYDESTGLPDNRTADLVETVALTGTRTLVASTFSTLCVFDGERWQRYSHPEFPLGGNLIALLDAVENGAPALWVGSGDGLARYSRGRWSVFNRGEGLPVPGVWSLGQSKSGGSLQSLWIGTSGGGLAQLRAGSWRAITTQEGLPAESTYSLLETEASDGARALWIGTNTLARVEGGKCYTISAPKPYAAGYIRCLLAAPGPDGERVVWAGTENTGLAMVRDDRWTFVDTRTVYRDGSPFNGAYINALLEDDTERGRSILVGSADELTRLYTDTLSVESVPLPVARTPVLSLAKSVGPDGERTLWVGTAAGLVRQSPSTSAVVTMEDGLPNDSVLCVKPLPSAGPSSAIWVGTRGGGAARLDLSEPSAGWSVFSRETLPGMPNDTVYRIEEDSQGRIYFFTNIGIVRLTPLVPAASRPTDFTAYVFTVADGLPSNECNTGASMIDTHGRIWAGTIKGVAVFDPSTEIADDEPKPLVIERASLAGTQTAIALGVSLPHDHNAVDFEFALLSFFRESETRYRSQLVGFDETPSDWTQDYKRTYTNLPAGDFTLRVWARDAMGNVSGPVEHGFSIRPAPWATPWAYAIYAALFVGVAYGIARLRFRALRLRTADLERKIAERTAELAESERRALDASRAKSVFLSQMSHELRTPLNAVLGFAELMDGESGRTAEDRRKLGLIRQSGEHLLGLIDDVLAIAKIEAGATVLAERAFALAPLVASVEALLRPLTLAKGLVLGVSVEGTFPSAVVGDEGKLRQVLLNLLGNAVKFTETGSVKLRAAWSNGVGRFEVEDTGPGIAASEIEKLFVPFAQTEAGLRSRKGTGLGLAISRDFARLMHGDLTVRSAPGRGTTFTLEIELPEAETVGVAPAPRRALALLPGQEPFRLLVADDVDENRALLEEGLVALGFQVSVAADGSEAFDKWLRWRPHAILLDMHMPVMDGYEAARRIRSAESSALGTEVEKAESTIGPKRCLLVAVTASALEHERDDALASGCDAVVTKPFRLATIVELLDDRLGARFVYDDNARASDPPAAMPTAERIAALPGPLRAELTNLLLTGDVTGASRVLPAVARHDQALAALLHERLEAFDLDTLAELAESVLREAPAAGRGPSQ
jgi:signal transduction histidine kinase/ligand-binding sensor domain-containing protein/CheY-like chemotaxis protein